jgi:pyruvate/2-oxoglutarate dehydrogenase complex dihydrolipoamide dehydrogenase (E3) component
MRGDLVKVHVAACEPSGVDLIMSEARFVAQKTVTVAINDVGTCNIAGERIILSVGTHAMH